MVARVLAALLCALVFVPAAHAGGGVPQNLRGFVLRSNEAEDPTHTFARTPSFAWTSVRGATGYEFQLSASRSFAENAIVWEKDDLRSPLTPIPLSLPWTTGAPFSFYARVRALVGPNATAWSERYGFRMRAPQPPQSLSSGINPRPGMVRWTPVDGATAYEATFQYVGAWAEKQKVKTATTAADLREYYSLHNDLPQSLPTVWRVRAVREMDGKALNDLPSVSYGPWSQQFTTYEPPLGVGTLDPLGTISRSRATDVVAAPGPGSEPHELVPGFSWSGRYGLDGAGDCPPDVGATGVTCPLFRVHVYTDEDCVNRVHVGDTVGSPAYVPRLSNPLKYPGAPNELEEINAPGGVVLLGTAPSEGQTFDAGGDEIFAAGTDPDLPAPAEQPAPGKTADRRSGLWDSDWPDSRYYWTVVPVVPRITPDGAVEYHDVGFGEDMCIAGRMGTFGKTSAPAIERANGAPFVSGMASTGEIRGATGDRPVFFGRVVVTWKPAPGATKYQVQWSRRASPFRALGSVVTPATATLLDPGPGVWYYRVRGLDRSIPGRLQGMTWSDAQYLKIVARTFSVTRGRRTR